MSTYQLLHELAVDLAERHANDPATGRCPRCRVADCRWHQLAEEGTARYLRYEHAGVGQP